MGDMPISAPRMPSFDPTTFLKSFALKVQENMLQLVVFGAICAIVVGYLLYVIWAEYQKNPIKFKRHRVGKSGFKLSDILRKK